MAKFITSQTDDGLMPETLQRVFDKLLGVKRIMETTNKLDLSQFTGTEAYHRTFMFTPKLVHTDGVQYFADTAGCYWFLDIVATEIYPLTKKDPFLSIKLVVVNGSAQITVEDGDCEPLFIKEIVHTDCPQGLYEFFLSDDVLMLTSEY